MGAVLIVLPALLFLLGVVIAPLAAGVAAKNLMGQVNMASILPTEASFPAIALAGVGAVASLFAALAILRSRHLAAVASGMVAAVTIYPAILAFALPAAQTGFPSPRLAELIGGLRPCASGPAYSIGYHEPSLVFLTETGLRMNDREGAMAALANDPGTMVLVEDRWIRIIGEMPPSVTRATVTYFNPNRGKMATARLLTPDHPRWEACE